MDESKLDIKAIEVSTGFEFTPTMIDLDNTYEDINGKTQYRCLYQRSQASDDCEWKECYLVDKTKWKINEIELNYTEISHVSEALDFALFNMPSNDLKIWGKSIQKFYNSIVPKNSQIEIFNENGSLKSQIKCGFCNKEVDGNYIDRGMHFCNGECSVKQAKKEVNRVEILIQKIHSKETNGIKLNQEEQAFVDSLRSKR